jgi:hypothetical protein
MLHVATNSSTCYAFHLYYVATYILAQCICTTLQHVFLPLQLLLNSKPNNTYINLPVTAPLYPSILIQFIVRYLFPTCDYLFTAQKHIFHLLPAAPSFIRSANLTCTNTHTPWCCQPTVPPTGPATSTVTALPFRSCFQDHG